MALLRGSGGRPRRARTVLPRVRLIFDAACAAAYSSTLGAWPPAPLSGGGTGTAGGEELLADFELHLREGAGCEVQQAVRVAGLAQRAQPAGTSMEDGFSLGCDFWKNCCMGVLAYGAIWKWRAAISYETVGSEQADAG